MDESVGLEGLEEHINGGISLEMSLEHFERLEQLERETEEDVFDASQTLKKRLRQANYTNDEDEALVLAWQSVTFHAVAWDDQYGAKHYKPIE